MTYRHVVLLTLLAAIAGACGGGSGSTPTTPSPTPTPGPTGSTITINASGASPRELTVAPGTRVTFVNNDSRAHQMASDPHPEHFDCPEINDVGLLTPGQSRQTGNLVTTGSCGFHDHDDPDREALKGRIIIR